jgi:glycerate 2-kinase
VEILSNQRGFRRTPIREKIVDSLECAFEQNSPELKVLSFLKEREEMDFDGNLHVVGFGKAARGMFEGARKYFGNKITTARIIVPIEDKEDLVYPFLPGNHPLPSRESMESSKALLNSLKNLGKGDLVLVLISGGGSSLFESIKDGVDLVEYNETVKCLMRGGANIAELNSIRYLFSKTKGGGLLNFTYPAKVISLIISDVPGDFENTVASGPTSIPPKQSVIENTIKKFGHLCTIPQFVKEPENISYRASNNVILKNSDFVNSVCEKGTKNGLNTVNLGSGIEGSTEQVARFLVGKMRKLYERYKVPIFVVGGGETSTKLVESGIGGRNLELCLRVLLLMNKDEDFVFGSFGTDGIDGTSKAMGAIVDSETLSSLDRKYVFRALSMSNSLAPLELTNDVLFTGRTGTNLADIFTGYYAGKINGRAH